MLGQLSRDLALRSVSGSALDALMARHHGLVHAVLRRQCGGSLSYDERLQAGRIGLWPALVGYDPKRGTAFSTYAWPTIELDVSHEAVRLRLWAALVWLRHPAHSPPLCQMLGRNTVADYEHADALAQRWLRKPDLPLSQPRRASLWPNRRRGRHL